MLREDQHPCYYMCQEFGAKIHQDASHPPSRRAVMVENLFKFFSTKLVEVRGLKEDRVVVAVQEDAC